MRPGHFPAMPAAGLFAAGLALVPAVASAAIGACSVLLAAPVDFRRADGPGPVREVAVARAGRDGYATGGPVPLTQVSAQLSGADDPASRLGLTRFGRLPAPYAFCNSEAPISEDGQAAELVPLTGPALPTSGEAQDDGPHALATSAASGGPAMSDDRTSPGAIAAPFSQGPSSPLAAWPSFIGELTGPASDAADSPESWFWLMPSNYPGASGMGDVAGMGGGPGGGGGRRTAPSTGQPLRPDPSEGGPVDPSALTAAAPEPSDWMLLATGFGALGGLARHRRRHAPAA